MCGIQKLLYAWNSCSACSLKPSRRQHARGSKQNPQEASEWAPPCLRSGRRPSATFVPRAPLLGHSSDRGGQRSVIFSGCGRRVWEGKEVEAITVTHTPLTPVLSHARCSLPLVFIPTSCINMERGHMLCRSLQPGYSRGSVTPPHGTAPPTLPQFFFLSSSLLISAL